MISPAKISVVIPTRGDRQVSLQQLKNQLQHQSIPPIEIIIIENQIFPGKARNLGVQQAQGDCLLFLDDDAGLDGIGVVEALLATLQGSSTIGLVGGAITLPHVANRFQQTYARQFPRSHLFPPDKITDSDLVTTLCCMISRELFLKLGGFREDLIAGEDPEFRDRIRLAGYRIVLAPEVKIYHPPPMNLGGAMRRSYWYGRGDALISRKLKPESWRKSCQPFGLAKAIFKALGLPASLLFDLAALVEGKIVLRFGWIYFLCGYAHLYGYFKGRMKSSTLRSGDTRSDTAPIIPRLEPPSSDR